VTGEDGQGVLRVNLLAGAILLFLAVGEPTDYLLKEGRKGLSQQNEKLM
jgi:hypothetical protein